MFNLFKKRNKYYYSTSLAKRLIDVINQVKRNIKPDSDMTYCYYTTPSELIAMLDNCILEIQNGNMKVIDDLSVEFTVTSSLQEHSLGNGWSDEYLIIAEEFDKIERLIKN